MVRNVVRFVPEEGVGMEISWSHDDQVEGAEAHEWVKEHGGSCVPEKWLIMAYALYLRKG
jgi:hypothetical protein